MLKCLGVSRSGYRAFTKHKPSAAQQRKESVKADIQKIYDKSRQKPYRCSGKSQGGEGLRIYFENCSEI